MNRFIVSKGSCTCCDYFDCWDHVLLECIP